LGYVQRGGKASAFDRILATRLGATAVEELLNGNDGQMVGLVNGRIQTTPLQDAVTGDHEIDTRLWELARVMEE
jgi:6-phosphofructokinase 1